MKKKGVSSFDLFTIVLVDECEVMVYGRGDDPSWREIVADEGARVVC